MTAEEFALTYLPTAAEVSSGTGIDPRALLAQWANETAWATVVVGNNLGNIRCSPSTFCRYATLDDFAAACTLTWHNGYYGAVLAAVGVQAQLAAICASPWSSGHYGGSLASFYSPLEVTLAILDDINAGVRDLNQAHFYGEGTPNPPNQFSQLFDAKLHAIVAAELAKLPATMTTVAGLTPTQAQQLQETHDRVLKDLAP